MKLLYIDFNMPYLLKDTDHPVGGATIEWYAWIKGLEENNCEVGVLTWKGAINFVKKPHTINFIESYDREKGIPKLRWLYYRFPSLLKAVKKYNPNVIVQECASIDTGIIAFVAKILNVPFIYRVANDMDTDERLKMRLNFRQRILFKYGLKKSNAILCQNSYQYKKLRIKFNKEKLHIIHNPFYLEIKVEISNFSKRSYVAWIGIFQYQKNLPALYEVVKKLPHIEFHIAGKSSGSNLDENTKTALQRLSHCKNVIFIGYLKRTEVLPFLSKAYALLNTSHYEGFSNTYLEALSVGTPIVTTKYASPDNIIENNNIGFEVDDYSVLSLALKKIIDNKDYCSLSNRCRNYVVNNHDSVILSKRFINIIESNLYIH